MPGISFVFFDGSWIPAEYWDSYKSFSFMVNGWRRIQHMDDCAAWILG